MLKLKSRLQGVFLFMVTLIVVVCAMEAGATLLIQSQRFAVVDDPVLHHVWRPNHRLEHREWIAANPEYPNSYVRHTNGQGWLRTTDVSMDKPARTWRVFYVGDSFVEGTVPMEQTLPGQLEHALGPVLQRNGWNLEVINTGMSSWSPTLYNVLVREVLVDYAPDVIVVVVDMTDDYDDWRYRQVARFDEAGDPIAVPGGPPKSADVEAGSDESVETWVEVERFLRENSSLYSMIRERNTAVSPEETTGEDAEYDRWSWVRHSWDEATQDAVNHTLSMLEGIADVCEQEGIRLMLTGVPHRRQLGVSASGTAEWSARPHTVLDLLAAKHGVAYLDGLEAMKPHVRDIPKERFYYRDDIHMNPQGYEAWGSAHIEFFADPLNKLLPATAF
ncbi:MAG: hypothetical protein VX519_08700 [Myxococcota bacterium]|nr:hypothetical protein [Myxococcota bacterium]